MRHRKAGKQLGRNSSHRRALLRNLVTSLFKYEQVETTDAKAKTLRPVAEKMITLAKRGDLHARRQALAYLREKAIAHRLFDELGQRYVDRQGGYLRIVKKDNRKGDGAPISVVQLVAHEDKKSGRKKGKKSKAAKAAGVAKAEQDKVGRKSEATETEGSTSQKKEKKAESEMKEDDVTS